MIKDKRTSNSAGCGCFGSKVNKDITKFSHIETNDEIIAASLILEMMHREQNIAQQLLRCRLNPNQITLQFRDDLEYFIPQIINQVLRSTADYVLEFFIKAAQVDFFFAHTFYFAWRSIVNPDAPEIENYLRQFLSVLSRAYSQTLLIAAYFENYQFNDGLQQQVSKGMPFTQDFKIPDRLQAYGTLFYSHCVLNDPLQFKNYEPIFRNPEPSGFCSTIDFWDDIICISQNLHLADPKLISLKADLQKINRGLPAAVYIPFLNIRNYVVLNIVVEESRVFSTKCRSPFYLCIEVYRPEEEAEMIPNPLRSSRLSLPRTVGGKDRGSIDNNETQDCTRNRPTMLCKIVEVSEDEKESTQSILSNMLKEDLTRSYYEDVDHIVSQYPKQQIGKKQLIEQLYGKDNTEMIRNKSPFRNFKTWKLAHLIVKSGDDLRQEQFAMQLIQAFDQIFKIEQSKLQLTTYEVISLGPGYGLIEVVRDALSIDSIKQKLSTLMKFKCLYEYFKLQASQAMISNFLNSLVAYSLVCYFLQIKDRHNGNILLHKEGYIVHIDFGFLLSNAPKGNLEKEVPFKMTEEYVEILGGYDSNLFKRFRRMFFEGFKMIRKHKNKVLLLVKTMRGSGLKCFKESTIWDLEDRFLGEELNDTQLFVACQKLIDQSCCNWRARWYDKYQYYFQGIMY